MWISSEARRSQGKVKSAYEPSGPSGRSVSRCPYHEATRSISTPPRMGCQSIAGLPPVLSLPVPIYTPGQRGAQRELSVLPKNTTQCPRPGLEPGDERTNHEATAPPWGGGGQLRNCLQGSLAFFVSPASWQTCHCLWIRRLPYQSKFSVISTAYNTDLWQVNIKIIIEKALSKVLSLLNTLRKYHEIVNCQTQVRNIS